jgi:hypothetical protein
MLLLNACSEVDAPFWMRVGWKRELLDLMVEKEGEVTFKEYL